MTEETDRRDYDRISRLTRMRLRNPILKIALASQLCADAGAKALANLIAKIGHDAAQFALPATETREKECV